MTAPATALDQSVSRRAYSPTTLKVLNPATLELIEELTCTTEQELNEAVLQSTAAQRIWNDELSADDRAERLRGIAGRIEDAAEELARLLSAEQGKPYAEALTEVAGAARAFRYFSTITLPDETIKSSSEQTVIRRHYPLGVAGLITAWNFPVALLSWKLSSALIAGNGAIIKPAQTTPLTARLLCRLAAPELPPGLVSVVIGGGALGDLIVQHPDIPKVSFTGSTQVGQKIMAAAAPGLKRLTLELGGNDPVIVLADSDPGFVAERIGAAAFRNAGQICIAPKRIFVHESLYEQVRDGLVGFLRKQVVGDGMEPQTTIGPVNNARQAEYLKELLADAAAGGARIDSPLPMPGLPGHFVAPAIVSGIDINARLVQEEQFGPLLPLIPFSDVDEAVEHANNSEFGLGASVWSSDIDAATEIAGRIRSGTVWINTHGPTELDVPLAGVKTSGLGVELGVDGVKSFCEAKIINRRNR